MVKSNKSKSPSNQIIDTINNVQANNVEENKEQINEWNISWEGKIAFGCLLAIIVSLCIWWIIALVVFVNIKKQKTKITSNNVQIVWEVEQMQLQKAIEEDQSIAKKEREMFIKQLDEIEEQIEDYIEAWKDPRDIIPLWYYQERNIDPTTLKVIGTETTLKELLWINDDFDDINEPIVDLKEEINEELGKMQEDLMMVQN